MGLSEEAQVLYQAIWEAKIDGFNKGHRYVTGSTGDFETDVLSRLEEHGWKLVKVEAEETR